MYVLPAVYDEDSGSLYEKEVTTQVFLFNEGKLATNASLK